MTFLGSRQGLGIAALMLAISAFLSRLMGLVRDKIISWQFGATGESDLYFAAFVVPDIINYLLAGAFMSITIIPLLAKGFAEDEENTWKFFSCVLFWLAVGSSLLTGLGQIWAEKLAYAVAPGFEPQQCRRLAFFMRIILPGQIFFLCGSCFTALLLLRRQFAVPSITPLVYNGLIITCGLCLPLIPQFSSAGMTGYCMGVSLGAFLGAFLLPMIIAAKGGLHLSFVWHHPWMGKFFAVALPLMLGQTVIMLDEQFLRVFGSMLSEGNVSLLNYGRRIAQVPIALMGQAIAVASYPFLVKLLAEGETDKFYSTLGKAMNAATLLIIPCSLWMLGAAMPILEIIFQGGRFGPAETAACLPLTRLMLLPAPFWIIYMVLVRGYYARGDTLTPALTGTVITLACIPVYWLLAVPAGAWAIAAVSGIGVTSYVIWLMLIWLKRHGAATFSGLGKTVSQALLCSAPATFCAWYLSEKIMAGFFLYSGFVTACVRLLASGIAFGICLLALAMFIAPEHLKKLPLPCRHN